MATVSKAKSEAGSSSPPKGTKEAFARFAEDPSRESFRKLLTGHLGEARHLDFKESWPDGPALAKHILGLGNTDGGALVIGVEEEPSGSLNPVGLPKLADKADILNGIKKYLPSELFVRVHPLDFTYDASEYSKIVGKSFQVLLVESSAEHTPFIAARSGTGIRDNAIYVRRDGLTDEASHSEVQGLLNRRIETQYSTSRELDLKKHIEQLRALYGEIPQFVTPSFFGNLGLGGIGRFAAKPNALYPAETVEQFIVRMIAAKKVRIADELDVDYEQ